MNASEPFKHDTQTASTDSRDGASVIERVTEPLRPPTGSNIKVVNETLAPDQGRHSRRFVGCSRRILSSPRRCQRHTRAEIKMSTHAIRSADTPGVISCRSAALSVVPGDWLP